MREINQKQSISSDIADRASVLFSDMRSAIFRCTDRLFACLMVFQWLAGVVAALLLSPTAWAGEQSQTHIHVWAAIFLGGAIAIAPLAMVLALPGRTLTRHGGAVAQMLTWGLVVGLT